MEVMRQVKVKYEDGVLGKGCIVMMAMRRKSGMVQTTMKRAWTTHEGKILINRTKTEIEIEGRRKPKRKGSFKIHSNSVSTWYDKGGSEYTGNGKIKLTKCISEHDDLTNMIFELEGIIVDKEKVHICIYYFHVDLIFLTY